MDIKDPSYKSFKLKISYGQGGRLKAPKFPWISFLKYNNTTSKGIYPIIFFDHENNQLTCKIGSSYENTPDIDESIIKQVESESLDESFDLDNLDNLVEILDQNIEIFENYFNDVSGYIDKSLQEKINNYANSIGLRAQKVRPKAKNWYQFYPKHANENEGTGGIHYEFIYNKNKKFCLDLHIEKSTKLSSINLHKLYEELIVLAENGYIQSYGKYLKKGFPSFRREVRVDDIEIEMDNIVDTFEETINKYYLKDQEDKTMNKYTELLKYQKQIILQGPPGTGKTRLAKKIINSMLSFNLVSNEEVDKYSKLIQFHPSYSYEDFVRGIVAKAEGESINYVAENKVLAQMAEDSKKEYDLALSEDREPKPYILVIDEINRANLSSVLGELIYALEYRDEPVESMYTIEGDNKIVLPSNLYIIGTMNTADRSIGHIDYAIRRRFTFVDVLSNEDNILNDFKLGNRLYQKTVKIFSHEGKFISPEFNTEDIIIGHSYFIATNEDGTEDLNKLSLKYLYQVLPLLKEYVKDGVFQKEPIITLGQHTIDLSKKIEISLNDIKDFLK